ncbi:MAG: RluA family pseudouridine synthase, partial [Eubacteriales bacterium]|nr:RluA family pseudouridine synthase [Eubacteriales bacterium]
EGKLDILYEDDYILILNKPSNMPVHPVKSHQENTLANFVAFRCGITNCDFIFRAVNRLDCNTSGIVIVAKDRHTTSLLQGADIEKHYIAVCHGVIDKSGTVNAPIRLCDNSKIVRCVSIDGKRAVTHYNPVKVMNDRTVLDIVLETGRTHQIRCHMSYLGHPLMGDDLYGGEREEISRQALHCGRVIFTHPYTEKTVDIEAPLPLDIQNLIK